MIRAFTVLLVALWLVAPAAAQTQEEGEMRLYIQQLEERIRLLTGQNERLLYEVNQLRAAAGMPAHQADPMQTGAVPVDPAQAGVQVGANLPAGSTSAAAPQDLGTLSVSPNDPLIAPDGALPADPNAPVDLSSLATGITPELVTPAPGTAPITDPSQQTVAVPVAPSPTTALSGSPRDEYDLAYGYILTGDYGLAEETFKAWLAAYPSDPQAIDAQFWLGESQLQQGKYRDAATAFLTVYKTAPDSIKGPDSLMKLGVSLSALGEKDAACGTFAELGKRYPQGSESLMSRVRDEQGKAGCS
jgi:tol-pal system protein YbgF